MAITRIYDFAWIIVLIGVIVITFGYGVQSAIDYSNTAYNASFFDSVGSTARSQLKNASDSQESIIQGEEGSGTTLTADGYLLGGLKSLFSLGGTWVAVRDAMAVGAAEVGVPAEFIVLVAAAMLITFAAILYTWFRGRG